MFFGTYEHSLDEKNRLVVPSRIIKNLIDKRLFIMRGYEGSLSLFPSDEFEKYLNKLNSFPLESKLSRDVSRLALSSVYELEIDKTNRIQLPTALVNKFAISKEVVVLGLGNHIEIWSKSKWNEYLKENEDSFEKISEELLKNV